MKICLLQKSTGSGLKKVTSPNFNSFWDFENKHKEVFRTELYCFSILQKIMNSFKKFKFQKPTKSYPEVSLHASNQVHQ